MALTQSHDGFRYFGPRQGMQCRCGAWLYPVSGAMVDQVAEWRFHVQKETGAWPQQEYPQGAGK